MADIHESGIRYSNAKNPGTDPGFYDALYYSIIPPPRTMSSS